MRIVNLYAIHMLEVQIQKGARQAYRHGMRCTGKAPENPHQSTNVATHPETEVSGRSIVVTEGIPQLRFGFCTNEVTVYYT